MVQNSETPNTLQISNAQVLPFDGSSKVYESIVIKDGRIAGVGTNEEMKNLAGSGSTIIDAKGATVMPGIVDTHPHLLHFQAEKAHLLDISDAVDHADIVARIKEKVKETPKGEWIMTTPVGEPSYFIRRSWRDLEEGYLPDRHVLDSATSDHPVMIQALAPNVPAKCAFNTSGLKKVGLSSTMPDRICDVFLEKDPNGQLTGILSGNVTLSYYNYDPFWQQLTAKLPVATLEQLGASVMKGMYNYNKMGVTTIYEGHCMEPEHIFAYKGMREQGLTTMRIKCAMEAEGYSFAPWDPLSMDEFKQRLLFAESLIDDNKDDLFRVEGITISNGGPCVPGFLRTYDKYKGPYGEDTNGWDFISYEKIEEFVKFCAEHNVRLNGCMGAYRDHDELLAAMEKFAEKFNIQDRRWLIQHWILTSEAQIKRYAKLGVEGTTSVSFSWGKGQMYDERIGHQCLKDLINTESIINNGIPLAYGTDWGPKNIWEMMRWGETRECYDSREYHNNCTGILPNKGTSREKTLKMWTSEAAEIINWPDVGKLVQGMFGDVIILDRNPLTCSIDDLPNTKVMRTILGGKTVYDSGDLKN